MKFFVSRVMLKVFDNNPTAHSCYKNSGFVEYIEVNNENSSNI